MKTISSKVIAVVLTVMTIFATAIPTFAADAVNSKGSKGTDIAVLDDSNYNVAGKDTTQNKQSEYDLYTYDGNDIISSVNVYGTIADGSDVYDPENPYADDDGFVNGKVQVGVPTTIIIDGKANAEGYYVGEASGKVKGNISGATVISVVPDNEVTLHSQGKNDVTAPIEQDYTQFVVETSELTGEKVNKFVTPSFNDKAVFDVSIKTKDLTAGSWSGTFNYNISLTNTTIASLGNRVTSWNISATENDNVWMSYYQANNRQMASNTRGTNIEKYEDGAVVISGTGKMEESVNKHFFDLDGMNEKLNTLIWGYLKENLSDEEYASVINEVDEYFAVWYYESAYSLMYRNYAELSNASKQFFTDAVNTVKSQVNAYEYIKYVPKKVIIMDGVTNVSRGAFNGCSKLTEVSLGNTIKEISDLSFMNCGQLTELIIPESCEVLGNLFSNTGAVRTVRIPASVRNIPNSTSFLTKSVIIDEANQYYFVQDGVIYTKDGKTLVGLTKDSPADLVVLEGVETIRDGSCQKQMNSLTLPASLQNMGVNVFMNYSNLEVICKSQRGYDLMMNLIEAKQNSIAPFKGTVTLAIDYYKPNN